MQWQQGRQNSKYCKLPLITFPNFDMYILKIPQGSSVPTHIDPIDGKNHYRLNIDLIKPKVGGTFIGKTLFKLPRVTLIRPDIHPHSVTEIFSGHSLILSVGFAINKRKS